VSPEQTKLEAETREAIDAKLEAAGWVIQDKNRLNLYESLGVAVREMDTDTGPADYMLFVNGENRGRNTVVFVENSVPTPVLRKGKPGL